MNNKPIWLVSRVGILICFVVLPLIRMHERKNLMQYWKYSDEFWKASNSRNYSEMLFWRDKMSNEFLKIYPPKER